MRGRLIPSFFFYSFTAYATRGCPQFLNMSKSFANSRLSFCGSCIHVIFKKWKVGNQVVCEISILLCWLHCDIYSTINYVDTTSFCSASQTSANLLIYYGSSLEFYHNFCFHCSLMGFVVVWSSEGWFRKLINFILNILTWSIK